MNKLFFDNLFEKNLLFNTYSMSLNSFVKGFNEFFFFSRSFEKISKFVVYNSWKMYKKNIKMNNIFFGPFILRNYNPTHIVCLWILSTSSTPFSPLRSSNFSLYLAEQSGLVLSLSNPLEIKSSIEESHDLFKLFFQKHNFTFKSNQGMIF
jgi:hypothetical protein